MTSISPLLLSLHRKLVVSCQAFPNDPMEDTETLRRVARSAVSGGASGLRLNGIADVRAVRQDTDLPIIAIEKSYAGGQLRITPDFAAAAGLAAAGASIIALDCTDRAFPHGEPWQEILRRIHEELGLLVMADIATFAEGVAAAMQGADLIGTTLRGYTEQTRGLSNFSPELVRDLTRETGRPVVAEGNVSTPTLARTALDAGAWCVVVGSAITRPGVITAEFVKAMEMSIPAAAVQSRRYALGVDIGGTAIKAAIVDDGGGIHRSHFLPTAAHEGRDVIAENLRRAISQSREDAETEGLSLMGIGIASAGAIDAGTGTVFAATENLPGWTGFDIRGHVATFDQLPVFVENDAQAAALAELRFGAAKQLSNFVAITLGTGIGGGLVLGGRLVRGRFGFGGTVGHQTICVDGELCNCGRRGCLEAYVSTLALVKEYQRLTHEDESKQTVADRARDIAKLAIEGDSAAVASFQRLTAYLAEGLANVVNLIDPEAILISGGLIEGQLDFEEALARKTQSLLHFGVKRPVRILRSSAGVFAGVQGAAASVFDQV